MDYDTYRHFADSWGLLYLFIVFCFVILWVFRPGSRRTMDEAARIPFNGDE